MLSLKIAGDSPFGHSDKESIVFGCKSQYVVAMQMLNTDLAGFTSEE